MAFQMSFTDSYGDTYPNAYFHVVQTNLCKAEKTGSLIFYGFQDAAHAGKRIIGQKTYTISAADYDTYFSAAAIDPAGVDHLKQAYLYATATHDVDTGTKDSNGKEIMKSFFDGATSV